MAAPVVSNPSCLELTETAIKKDNFGDWIHCHYSKNSFLGKANTKPQGISNLVLANREAQLAAPSGLDFPPQNQWAALRAAHQFVGQKSESLILEYIYDCARTHFIKNS